MIKDKMEDFIHNTCQHCDHKSQCKDDEGAWMEDKIEDCMSEYEGGEE